MIQLLSITKHNIGLSNVKFIIGTDVYEFHTDACHVNKCERMSRFSDKKALNYIKKHVINTIKFRKKDEE